MLASDVELVSDLGLSWSRTLDLFLGKGFELQEQTLTGFGFLQTEHTWEIAQISEFYHTDVKLVRFFCFCALLSIEKDDTSVLTNMAWVCFGYNVGSFTGTSCFE